MILFWGFVLLALANIAITHPTTQVWGQLRENIKYVNYLTLENHSFDNIAGYWDFHPDIDNLRNLTYCNDYANPNWTVYGEPLAICAEPYATEVTLKDPHHNFGGVIYEIFRQWNPTKEDIPNMAGFIERQSEKYNATPGDSAFVIKALSQKKTLTLAELASNFAFFDSSFAEHPGPTNPNCQFATSGSTCGFVDNTHQSAGFGTNVTGTTLSRDRHNRKSVAPFTHPSVSSVANDDIKWVQDNAMDRLIHATELYHDLEAGTLPSFSYLNPECCTIDSMHPTSNMAAGEQMVKHLYDALRRSKYWDNAVLINFDEHGGFADYVPTPVNVPQPEDGIIFKSMSSNHNFTYDFTRLRVR
ncbi:hypothetical protein PENCOP_c001G02574 [Penicillium coprophilum]|uniref:Uncharacterized protein n=1 Tax=Penicillium coprophilum TaxID=36646 RepID=A0A1V6VA96_9EURO|nr:hypothetical protein PENCOP_c001G02574 [Penicillium coprophilum]